MLSRVGEKLQAETKRIIDICYNQIQSLLSHDIKEVRRQYWMFARQLHDRNAKLCAAGFLYIDHSLILYFATIVCVKNNFWFYKQITYTASEDTKDWNKFFKIYKLLLKKTLRPVNSYFSLHIFALNVIYLFKGKFLRNTTIHVIKMIWSRLIIGLNVTKNLPNVFVLNLYQ